MNTKRPQGRQPGTRDPRAAGTGIVWEIFQASGASTKIEFAKQIGAGLRSVEQWTANGTQPTRNHKARANLLSTALLIPEPQRTKAIKAWIESEREYWRDIAPPGVFL